jgi:hypothetical protein
LAILRQQAWWPVCRDISLFSIRKVKAEYFKTGNGQTKMGSKQIGQSRGEAHTQTDETRSRKMCLVVSGLPPVPRRVTGARCWWQI